MNDDLQSKIETTIKRALEPVLNEISGMRQDLDGNCTDTGLIKREIIGEIGDDRPGLRTRIERTEESLKRTDDRVQKMYDLKREVILWTIGAIISAVTAGISAMWVALSTWVH